MQKKKIADPFDKLLKVVIVDAVLSELVDLSEDNGTPLGRRAFTGKVFKEGRNFRLDFAEAEQFTKGDQVIEVDNDIRSAAGDVCSELAERIEANMSGSFRRVPRTDDDYITERFSANNLPDLVNGINAGLSQQNRIDAKKYLGIGK